MDWNDFLDEERVIMMPYLGGNTVCDRTGRAYKLVDKPRTFGFYEFSVKYGKAKLVSGSEVEWRWSINHAHVSSHYVFGNRKIPRTGAKSYKELVAVGDQIYFLSDPQSFCHVRVVPWSAYYMAIGRDFPTNVEREVETRFLEGRPIDDVRGVTPDLASLFNLMVEKRAADAARAEKQRRLRELRELENTVASAAGRRRLALVNFEEAAKAALSTAEADLLFVRPTIIEGQREVAYTVEGRRLSCVVDMNLHVIDAGICLTDHNTGEKDDELLTLESLPLVAREAIKTHQLVVWRHV